MGAMIEIQDLSKRFGQLTAVDGVSFSVERGEVLGFLGPNGAGKSTTMKMITGFLAPSSGRITVCGHDVASDPMAAKEVIGYLPEGAPAYPDMTPAAFLNFVGEIRGFSPAERAERIREVRQKVHLEGVMKQSIETLSKGYKRRVGLAQAILHDPDVLIMDEPTDGLDPNQKDEVRSLIRAMAAEKAIVISTHILEEVEAVCSRAMIINSGRIVFDGTPADLEARSRHHGAVSLSVPSAAGEEVRGELAGLTGVAAVEEQPSRNGQVAFVAFPAAGQSIVEEVSRHARSRNWEVGELRVEHGRLDEVFRKLTTSETEQEA